MGKPIDLAQRFFEPALLLFVIYQPPWGFDGKKSFTVAELSRATGLARHRIYRALHFLKVNRAVYVEWQDKTFNTKFTPESVAHILGEANKGPQAFFAALRAHRLEREKIAPYIKKEK